MPSGRVHEAINTAALLVAGTAAAWATQQQLIPESTWKLGGPASLGVLAYVIGTFMITPDLDLADGKVNAKRRWGPLGWLWVPYGVISRHRGRSHSYVLGPVSRLLYLLLFAGLALAALRLFGVDFRPVFKHPGAGACWMLGGYLISQWLHLIADGIWPWDRH